MASIPAWNSFYSYQVHQKNICIITDGSMNYNKRYKHSLHSSKQHCDNLQCQIRFSTYAGASLGGVELSEGHAYFCKRTNINYGAVICIESLTL